MKRASLAEWSAWVKFCLTGSIGILAALSIHPKSVQAQTTLPSFPGLNFQTSACTRGPNIGDWYTTQTSASTDRVHRFFVSITAADIAAAGGAAVISVQDAESNGPDVGTLFDEVDGAAIGSAGGTPDPTRFQLLGPDGSVLSDQTVPSGSASGTTLAFPAITAPGVYTVTSQTGSTPLDCSGPANLNDDDNGFRIVVPITDLLIGQFQGTFQQNTGATATIPLFFLVGPGTGGLRLRNFDADGGFTVDYTRPSGASQGGTASGNGVWNGPGGTLNTGEDTISGLAPIADAGRWTITLNDFTNNNQSLLEANTDVARLPLFDAPPRRAGNFTITSSSTPAPGGDGVCYAFTVTNLFFTSDIINLDLSPTDPSIIAQFRDAAGNPLTDTDGDGKLDTGILQVNEARTYSVCITSPTPPPSNLNVQGTSFMDARIRQQANNGAPTPVLFPLSVSSSTTGGAANLRLVKRITNVTRGGAVLPGVNFGAVIDDPSTSDDNAAGWTQISLTGVLALDTSNPVRSGDEVTYTVYFLSDGTAPALDTSICDLIPGGMTYVVNSTDVKLASANPVSGGTFFTPLAPLPANNSCPIQENPNGATIVDLGTVSNAAGSNFGFIRFRVRVN